MALGQLVFHVACLEKVGREYVAAPGVSGGNPSAPARGFQMEPQFEEAIVYPASREVTTDCVSATGYSLEKRMTDPKRPKVFQLWNQKL